MITKIGQLVAELDEYLPAAVRNQHLAPHGPTGPGTLAGFHAKIAEVFQLGRSIGWDERAELDPDPDPKDGIDDRYVKRLMGIPQYGDES